MYENEDIIVYAGRIWLTTMCFLLIVVVDYLFVIYNVVGDVVLAVIFIIFNATEST